MIDSICRLARYINNNHKVGTFGIKYLDERLRGILKGDLILIGARSGAGKSTIADMIAMHNANKGVKVHIFSLENFDDDAFATKAFYKYRELTGDWKLEQRDFASGDFNLNPEAFIQANDYAENIYKHLKVTSRKADYTTEKLCDDMGRAVSQEGAELLIIDHLDYVEKNSPNENDNTHMTVLMKKIRELQDSVKVAVIAISHLRKAQNTRDLPIIPSVDEFTGSSNKVKESTAVIMIAPYDKMNEDKMTQRKATWFSIKKLRMGGIDNKNGLLYFDRRIGEYDPEYEEYVVRGQEVTKIV